MSIDERLQAYNAYFVSQKTREMMGKMRARAKEKPLAADTEYQLLEPIFQIIASRCDQLELSKLKYHDRCEVINHLLGVLERIQKKFHSTDRKPLFKVINDQIDYYRARIFQLYGDIEGNREKACKLYFSSWHQFQKIVERNKALPDLLSPNHQEIDAHYARLCISLGRHHYPFNDFSTKSTNPCTESAFRWFSMASQLTKKPAILVRLFWAISTEHRGNNCLTEAKAYIRMAISLSKISDYCFFEELIKHKKYIENLEKVNSILAVNDDALALCDIKQRITELERIKLSMADMNTKDERINQSRKMIRSKIRRHEFRLKKSSDDTAGTELEQGRSTQLRHRIEAGIKQVADYLSNAYDYTNDFNYESEDMLLKAQEETLRDLRAMVRCVNDSSMYEKINLIENALRCHRYHLDAEHHYAMASTSSSEVNVFHYRTALACLDEIVDLESDAEKKLSVITRRKKIGLSAVSTFLDSAGQREAHDGTDIFSALEFIQYANAQQKKQIVDWLGQTDQSAKVDKLVQDDIKQMDICLQMNQYSEALCYCHGALAVIEQLGDANERRRLHDYLGCKSDEIKSEVDALNIKKQKIDQLLELAKRQTIYEKPGLMNDFETLIALSSDAFNYQLQTIMHYKTLCAINLHLLNASTQCFIENTFEASQSLIASKHLWETMPSSNKSIAAQMVSVQEDINNLKAEDTVVSLHESGQCFFSGDKQQVIAPEQDRSNWGRLSGL